MDLGGGDEVKRIDLCANTTTHCSQVSQSAWPWSPLDIGHSPPPATAAAAPPPHPIPIFNPPKGRTPLLEIACDGLCISHRKLSNDQQQAVTEQQLSHPPSSFLIPLFPPSSPPHPSISFHTKSPPPLPTSGFSFSPVAVVIPWPTGVSPLHLLMGANWEQRMGKIEEGWDYPPTNGPRIDPRGRHLHRRLIRGRQKAMANTQTKR